MTSRQQVVDPTQWVSAATQAKREGHEFFDLLTAVDLGPEGFDVVLRLWDPQRRTAMLLTTRCPLSDPQVPTLVGLFAGAAWHERATAELFGIAFTGHDTVPLLLPGDFGAYPLRKDFVLAARVAKRWPGVKEPGESEADLATPRRRRLQPPGVPSGWGTP